MSDGARIGTAVLDVDADFTQAKKQVAAFASHLGKTGKAAAALGAVTAGAVVAGKALYEIGENFDTAEDKIRVGTGKTGKQLKGLQRDLKAVLSGVPASFDDAGTAVSELNKRLGVSGKPLRKLSKQFLELSNVTETDLSGNIKGAARAFEDWDVPVKRQTKILDQFFRASQMSGASVEELSSLVVQFGSPLRQLGFNLNEATAMFASFEKSGVNIQTMMPGLRQALGNFLEEGRDPHTALTKTFKGIESGALSSERILKIFGKRAGADLVEAVEQGRFHLAKFQKQIASGDTIRKAAKDTRDFTEHWELFKNRVMVKLAPLSARVFNQVGDAMEKVGGILTDPKLTNDEKFSKIFDMVTEAASEAIAEISSKAGQFAPKAAHAFVKGFAEADAWGKLAIGSLLLSKFGTRGGIVAAGTTAGRLFGSGVSAGAASTALTGGAVGLAGTAAAGAGSRWLGSEGSKAAFMRSQGLTMPATVKQSLAAQGGIFAGAAGASAASKFETGFLGKLKAIRWGRVGGIGLGLWAADEAISEFSRRTNERSDDLESALGSIGERGFMTTAAQLASGKVGNKDANEEESKAKQLLSRFRELQETRIRLTAAGLQDLRQKAQELDLTKEQRAQVASMIELLSRGQNLRTKVDLGMDPRKLAEIQQGLHFLGQGVGANLADINRVAARTGRLIATTFGEKTAEGRKLAATNMRATAAAIGQQMTRSGNFTKEGMARIRRLIGNADLVAPTRKQAQAFGHEWARGMSRSKDITSEGLRAMISEANKMPREMRQIALRTWLDHTKQAKRSGDITADEFRSMRSRVLSEFGAIQKGSRQKSKEMADGIVANIDRLVRTTSDSLGNFRSVVNAALVGFGAKPLQFSVNVGGEKRQRGGPIDIGKPSGDSVPAMLERGEYVLNRKAVKAVGREKLDAINFAAAPRFQKGGHLGPEPQMTGTGPLRTLGQQAIKTVYEGGQSFLKKHMPSGGGFANLKGSGAALMKEISRRRRWHFPDWWALDDAETDHGRNLVNPESSARLRGQFLSMNYGKYGPGSDPAQNPSMREQIISMARYIAERYGNPSKAWAWHQAHNWYAKGGLVGKLKRLAGGGMIDPSWDPGSEQIASSIAQLTGAMAGRFDFDITQGYGPGGPSVSSGHQVTGTALDVVPRSGNWGGAFAKGLETLASLGFEVGYDGSVPGTEAWPDHGRGNHAHIEMVGNGTAADARKRLREYLSNAGVSLAGGAKGPTEGEKTRAEAKTRKKQREGMLKKLRGLVGDAKTLPAKQSSLWKLLKFWGRVGMFDKGERGHILEAVQKAAAQINPEGRVKILSRLAGYAADHGEITGRDPDNWHSMTDAIANAQKRGADERERTVKKHERQRNRKKRKIEGRGEFAGLAEMLFGRKRAYEGASQTAERLVALEPEDLTDEYVGQERGAWGGVLDTLAAWRDKTVYVRNTARAKTEVMEGEIKKIKELTGQAFQKQKWRLQPLRKAVANGQAFIAERTTDMEDFQGIGGPQTMLGSLGENTPWWLTLGSPGRSIFDTQNTIRELGLKLGDLGGGEKPDDSQRIATLEKLLRESNQRGLAQGVLENTRTGFESTYPFMGAFAKGGVALVGERGPELVHMPEGTRVHSAQDTAQILEPKIIVNGDIVNTPPGKDPVEAVLGDRRFAPAVHGAMRSARPLGRPTPGGRGRR